jgi:hypothetical protein
MAELTCYNSGKGFVGDLSEEHRIVRGDQQSEVAGVGSRRRDDESGLWLLFCRHRSPTVWNSRDHSSTLPRYYRSMSLFVFAQVLRGKRPARFLDETPTHLSSQSPTAIFLARFAFRSRHMFRRQSRAATPLVTSLAKAKRGIQVRARLGKDPFDSSRLFFFARRNSGLRLLVFYSSHR